MKKKEQKHDDKRKPQPKKTYIRPELEKHGQVETVTQTVVGGPSGPIQWPS